jgi:hypothetical protein
MLAYLAVYQGCLTHMRSAKCPHIAYHMKRFGSHILGRASGSKDSIAVDKSKCDQSGCPPWNARNCSDAAVSGHLPVFQLAHANAPNGCPWDESIR